VIPNKIVNSTYGPMIINANDQYIGRSVEIYGAWAQDDIDLIKNLLDLLLAKKEKVIFYDVGANIGTHTVSLAKLFGNKIAVRSFEAQRQIYYVLCGNVAINGLDNVHVHHAAVSNVANDSITVDLPDYTLPNNFGGLELIQTERTDNQYMTKTRRETVNTVTIDQFDDAVDFLKLDIEGMEHLALQGAKKTIDTHRPICFVEMWKTDIEAVKKFFKQANYRAYAYKPDDWIFFPNEGTLGLLNKQPEVL
jgi:FkbM family methyltransferase